MFTGRVAPHDFHTVCPISAREDTPTFAAFKSQDFRDNPVMLAARWRPI